MEGYCGQTNTFNSIGQLEWILEASYYYMEKPRDFDPFGQTGLSPLATI